MNRAILTTERLSIGYAPRRGSRRVVASDLNLTLATGEVVCLLGPNGVGKSTLLRTLVGLQPPLDGRIFLDNTDLTRLSPRDVARRLSVVLTDRVEVGQLTVYMLVALGRHPYTGWMGRLAPNDEAIVRRALEAVDAVELATRMVHELSDGERQRVMIARALAQEPLVMALDEPTAFLDLPRRVEIMHLLRRLAHETNRAMILSTHDLDLALRTADTLWLMAPGGAVYTGAPEDLVLSGAFEATFAGNGISFDRNQGHFRIYPPAQRYVALEGEGTVREWTARALERAGCLVVTGDDSASLRVAANHEHQRPYWEIRTNGAAPQRVTSLRELVTIIRHGQQDTKGGAYDNIP